MAKVEWHNGCYKDEGGDSTIASKRASNRNNEKNITNYWGSANTMRYMRNDTLIVNRVALALACCLATTLKGQNLFVVDNVWNSIAG